MIDHIGFPVSDYARSKAFYESALAPLGYTLIMEVAADHTDSGSPAAGFGKQGKPISGSAAKAGSKARCTSQSPPMIAAPSTPFTAPQSPRAAGTTARRVCAPIIIRTTTAPLCSIPMAAMSRRCATHRHSRRRSAGNHARGWRCSKGVNARGSNCDQRRDSAMRRLII